MLSRELETERPICACHVRPEGRGVVRCIYHDNIIREHQAMYYALKAISEGKGPKSVPAETFAAHALAKVKFRR